MRTVCSQALDMGIEPVSRYPFRIIRCLQQKGESRTDEDDASDAASSMTGEIAYDFATSDRMADQRHLAQIKLFNPAKPMLCTSMHRTLDSPTGTTRSGT